jgi:beta-lactamase regulating signal transducer with metallopeptidase domain
MNAIWSAFANAAAGSVLIAAAFGIGLHFVPRRVMPASSRYAIWWIVLIATALLPLSRLPHWVVAPAPAQHIGAKNNHWMNAPNVPSGAYVSERVETSKAKHNLFPIDVANSAWLFGAGALWMLTTAFLLARIAAGSVLLARLKRRAAMAPPYLVACIPEWLSMSGSSRRRISMAVSTEIFTPVAAGFFTPTVLIPARLLEDLSASELDQVCLHETAHLGRYDDYTLIIERLIEALLPWHPVVRWIGRQIDLEREIACDDIVIKSAADARNYARCLTRVVEFAGTHSRCTSLSLPRTKPQTSRRESTCCWVAAAGPSTGS